MTQAKSEWGEWRQICLFTVIMGVALRLGSALRDLPPLVGPVQVGVAVCIACLGTYWFITGAMSLRRPVRPGKPAPVFTARQALFTGVLLVLVAVVLVATPPTQPRTFHIVKGIIISMAVGAPVGFVSARFVRRAQASGKRGGAVQ